MRRNEGVRFKTDSLVLIGRLPLFLHDRHIIDEETPLAGLRLVRLTHDRDRIFRFEVGNLHHDLFPHHIRQHGRIVVGGVIVACFALYKGRYTIYIYNPLSFSIGTYIQVYAIKP